MKTVPKFKTELKVYFLIICKCMIYDFFFLFYFINYQPCTINMYTTYKYS